MSKILFIQKSVSVAALAGSILLGDVVSRVFRIDTTGINLEKTIVENRPSKAPDLAPQFNRWLNRHDPLYRTFKV